MSWHSRAGLAALALLSRQTVAADADAGRTTSPRPQLEFKLVADYSNALDPLRKVLPRCTLDGNELSLPVPAKGCWTTEAVNPEARIVPGTSQRASGQGGEADAVLYVVANTRDELQKVIDAQVKSLLGKELEIGVGEDALGERALETSYYRTYLLASETGLAGQYVEEAGVRVDNPRSDGQGDPVVTFTLSPEGGWRMEKFTSANMHRRLAVLFGGEVETAATIDSAIGNEGMITLASGPYQHRLDEANAIARVLGKGRPSPPAAVPDGPAPGARTGPGFAQKLAIAAVMAFVLLVVIFLARHTARPGRKQG